MNTIFNKEDTLTNLHRRDMLTRVTYFAKYFSQFRGDIIVNSTNNYLLSVCFIASIISKKKMYVTTDSDAIQFLIRSNSISLYIINGVINDDLSKLDKFNLDAQVMIYDRMFNYNSDPSTWSHTIAVTSIVFALQDIQINSIVKISDITKILTKNNENDNEILSIYQNNSDVLYNYTQKNVYNLLNVLDSEFKNHKYDIIDFSKTAFKESVMYLLYFILYNHKDVIYNNKLELSMTNRFKYNKIKKLVFVDKKHQNSIYKNQVLFKIVKPFIWNTLYPNKALGLFRKLFNTHLLKTIFKLKLKDELIFLNAPNGANFNLITKESFIKCSYTFAELVSANVLAINRYDNKDIDILKNEFRFIDRESNLRFGVNSLNQLMISGDTICNDYLSELSKLTQKRELYYNTEIYVTVQGDVVSVKGYKEDIWYDSEFNPINIGYIKKAIQLLPYVEKTLIMITERKGILQVIPFVSLRTKLIDKVFTSTNVFDVETHINDYVKSFNHSTKIKIHNVVIEDSKRFSNLENIFKSQYNFMRSVASSLAN